MTHEKFIELLNLYLDGALLPDETAALEREIHSNVARHRIYRQYCQMQKACGALAARFCEEAGPAAQFRSGAVVELPRRASGDWFRSIALVASGALAACAVFVVFRTHAPEQAIPTMAQAAPTSGPTVPAVMAMQPVPSTTTVALSNPAVFNNPWAVGQRSTQRMVSFSKFSPGDRALMLSVPELKLPPGTENLPVDLQPYGTAPGSPLRMEEIEAAAFQFPR
jgi:anti-sigma factor RsiW